MADYTSSMMQRLEVDDAQAEHIIAAAERLSDYLDDLEMDGEDPVIPEGVESRWEALIRASADTADLSFDLELTQEALYIRDAYDAVDELQVVTFLQTMQDELDIDEPWSFEVSYGCSKHRPDAFGGSAYVVTRNEYDSIGTRDWIQQTMTEMRPEETPTP